jgi:4-aminobutyrate aminotransferase-like enzyme
MVGLKVIEVVRRDGLAGRAAELGDRLKRGLLSLKQRYSYIGDVRGRGLLLGLEFKALDRDQTHSARARSDTVTDNALRLGLSANNPVGCHNCGQRQSGAKRLRQHQDIRHHSVPLEREHFPRTCAVPG